MLVKIKPRKWQEKNELTRKSILIRLLAKYRPKYITKERRLFNNKREY